MEASNPMETFLEELKQRALRELKRRDGEGKYLDLTYKQIQALKNEDFGRILPIVDRRIRRDRRMLWMMGIIVPLFLVMEIYLGMHSVGGSWGRVAEFGLPALLSIFFMGYALHVGLPRLASLEKARLLLELYVERVGAAPHPGRSVGAPVQRPARALHG